MATEDNTGKSKSRRKTKRIYHTMMLLAIGCLFCIVATLVQPFNSTNLWFSDQLFRSDSPSQNIIIIGIDNDSLQTYGKWSEWSRDLHAQAIINLSEADATVIGYDVLFLDESSDDPVLSSAIKEAGNVVLAATGANAQPKIKPFATYNDFLLPVNLLHQVSNKIGHVNIEPDHDGKVRRLALLEQDSSGNLYPSFSLAVLLTHWREPVPEQYILEGKKLHILDRGIPVDSASRLRINHSVDYERYEYISYGDVISNDFDHSLVKNKAVLIGMTATGELDVWAVPTTSGKIPGVYIHAMAADTIIRENYLTEASKIITLITLLLLAGIVAFALPYMKLQWSTLLLSALFIFYAVSIIISYDTGYILNILYPLSLIAVLFVSNVICLIVIGQSDKRFVSDLFGRYVSPQVANEILNMADNGQLNLGGETREVTVLFADIRHFTQMSEQMPPGSIVSMLNEHLSIIIDIVLQNGGMVNKFAGDNIMAVWNAPEIQKDHARLAIKAAVEAQQALMALPQIDTSQTRVQFGIGINTGDAIAGNVGSAGRVEYTVIGDSVNLASRICSITPGDETWIGPETYRQAQEYLEVQELEAQKFKGKAEPVQVYRITAFH
ncbi:CHASE2 domain-containing protein [Chloroflexota bacterium]